VGDACENGECKGGPDSLVCDDENPCTEDECIEGEGCLFTDISDITVPCDDGNDCTTDDYCLDGECVAGWIVCECEEDEDCPSDDDMCNGVLVCDYEQWPYKCMLDPESLVSCEEPADPCLKAECDPDTGQCFNSPVKDGKPCDDGDDCTNGDVCVEGKCSPGTMICECKVDVDCTGFDDGNLCNGTFMCDHAQWPWACVLDPGTVVECPDPQDPCKESLCQPFTGECVESPVEDGKKCDDGDPCTGGDKCLDGECQPGAQDMCACPDDMVPVGGVFCIDIYEASRPDATTTSVGSDESMATSREGVLPWFHYNLAFATAEAACENAGKRLCTEDEVYTVCAGPDETMYIYGNEYSADICNGIDTFCKCDEAPCQDIDPCPYPHCYNLCPDGTYGEGCGCGALFHVTPTGYFPLCQDSYGAFDINGNVWELIDDGTGEVWFRGGAYNCGDSEKLHKCAGKYKNISAKGFRCCRNLVSGVR